MPYYFYLFAASNSHIEFISRYPDALWNFAEGSKCCLTESTSEQGFLQKLFDGGEAAATLVRAPEDWPTEPVKMIGPEVNTRTVELYHRLLCGGDVFVSGAGSLFQTWLIRENGVAIDIGGKGENFAFTSNLIPELKELVLEVDESRVMYQYCLWLRKQGRTNIPSDEELENFTRDFAKLGSELQKVEDEGKGLIWIKT